jgi:hypothetical protein
VGAPLLLTRSRLCLSVQCGWSLLLFLMPCATGVRGARHEGRGTFCWRRTTSEVSPAAGVAGGGVPHAVCPPPVWSAASVPRVRSAQDVAGGSVPSVRGRGREPGGAPLVPLSRPQVVGWHGALSGVARCASPTYAGVGGNVQTVSHLSQRVSRVRRGQSRACAPGWPAGGGAPGPAGTGQAGSRGRSGAEQGLAGDWK